MNRYGEAEVVERLGRESLRAATHSDLIGYRLDETGLGKKKSCMLGVYETTTAGNSPNTLAR